MSLVEAWDAQQAAYIADRERRFAVMLDVLALRFDGAFTVVDAACGPGSFAARILDRFDRAAVVALDHDPMLLALARSHLARFGGRARVVDADLTDPSWTDALDAPDALVSTTALHWLPPADLLTVYRQARKLLAPGGILLNGDHFRFDATTPAIRDWADRHDTATQEAARAEGAATWDEWWDAARRDPDIAALEPERTRRFDGRPVPDPTTAGFQPAALRQAGFHEAGTVWQLLDDYVIYGTT